jgi:hypothetical protein
MCRKNAPVPITSSSTPDALAAWPVVEEDDWCGEHKSKVEHHPLNMVDDAVSKERQRCLGIVDEELATLSVSNPSIGLLEKIFDAIKSPTHSQC